MASILLIADEPEIRYALTEVLGSAGHDIVGADNAETGRALLAEQDFELLVCDLQVTRDQGLGVLATARQCAPHMAVLAISGGGLAGAKEHLEAVKAFGVAGVLHKPFEIDTLIDKAESLLDRTAKRQPERRQREGQTASA